MTSKPEQPVERLIADADLAITQLEKSRREVCAEFNERVRKLRAAISTLQNERVSPDRELFETAPSISPDVLSLLENPLRGL